MNDVIDLVVDKYDGSLKAEHGTGRNMAPFVEYEWGRRGLRNNERSKTTLRPQRII